MKQTIPEITQKLMKFIDDNAKEGRYRIAIEEIVLDIFPYVFPPESPHSSSSKAVYRILNDVEGKKLLDIGTGSGILGIYAAKRGAYVDATDIDTNAIECAKHNVKMNNLNDRVNVFYSDVFSHVKNNYYDIIIANLPILSSDCTIDNYASLFDKEYGTHKKLFEHAEEHLAPSGRIIMSHADLESKNAFKQLEEMAVNHGYTYGILSSVNSLGHEWRTYEFKIKR